MNTHIMDTIKMYSELSNQFSTWSLSILAGSILTLISSSYIRPVNKKIRLIYLLFLPGWACLAVSILNNDFINRRVVAAYLTKSDTILVQIASLINYEFDTQLTFLNLSLCCFGLWLVLFLVWWIFGNIKN
jgi:hypothetical protein